MIDGNEALRRLMLKGAACTGIARLARPLLGGMGAILMLHRVTAQPQEPGGMNRHLAIAPAFLDALITDLKRQDYAFVTLDEAIGRIRQGGGRQRFIAITADDAYRDNLTDALPVLEKHGAPVTIYVAPGLIDHSVALWWEVIETIVNATDKLVLEAPGGGLSLDCATPRARARAVARLQRRLVAETREQDQNAVLAAWARATGIDPLAPSRDMLMDWEDLKRAAAHPLVTIGAHTIHHYNLRRLDEETARREIAGAGRILEERLGLRPRHMAYPYGYAEAVGPREVRLAAEAGYLSAVTTRHGLLHMGHGEHLQALPRISVNGRYQQLGYLRAMLSGITTPLANRGRMMVTI